VSENSTGRKTRRVRNDRTAGKVCCQTVGRKHTKRGKWAAVPGSRRSQTREYLYIHKRWKDSVEQVF